MTEDFFEKYSDIENCPIQNIIVRFGNKWSILILMIIYEKKVTRFGEFTKAL